MRRLPCLILACLFPTICAAQDYVLPDDIAQQAARQPDRFRDQMIQQLFQLSPNGALSEEQAQIHHERTETQNRETQMLVWRLNDLNGDGMVSEDEITRLRMVMTTSERARVESQLTAADVDGDGNVSDSESKAAFTAEIARSRSRRSNRHITTLQSLDFDQNGITTVEDIVAALASLSNTSAGAALALENAGCNLPIPSASAEIILFGAYEGQSVSTVAVAGLDQETSFATLNIEPGDTPLYIVATVFDAAVLNITGATERVERLVGSSQKALGVAGLEKEKVTFAPRKACGFHYFHDVNDQNIIQTKARVAAHLKRTPNHVLGAYGVESVSLPSGEGLETKKSKSRGVTIIQGNRRVQLTGGGIKDLGPKSASSTERDLLRYYPGGIASVMPEDVITAGDTALAYDVLPQQAGLLQLVDAGALSVMKNGTYSIDKPIARFPAGLNGGHSVQFLLRRGVPMPKGNPGHSSVLIEETGECLNGGRCRR